jgi:hypothetical protein
MGVEGVGMGIGLVGLKYWNSCGAEYMGLVGLLGEWAAKSMLARLLKRRRSCCVLAVDVVLVEAIELVRTFGLGSCMAVEGGDFAMGKDMPRNFPRLATPTPHVRVVR